MELNRRKFLQAGIGAALTARVVAAGEPLQAQQPGAAASAPPPQGEQPAATERKLTLDAYSRPLQWLRSPDEIADAVYEMSLDGLMPSVQKYPGHIAPERVAQDLPPFVKAMRDRGLRVTQVRGPELIDAGQPYAEEIIATASGLGITHYWFGANRYDLSKPIPPQLEAVKGRVDKFVKLNRKYGMKAMYHTYPSARLVGATVWDLLGVFQNFDPKYVGLHWDTGHMALHCGGMWELLMRAAGPYIAGIGWQDTGWVQDLGLGDQGGPYPGPAAIAALRAEEENAKAPRRGGNAAGRPPAGPGGPGGGFPSITEARPIPLPLASTLARGNGWKPVAVPLGEGLIDVPRIATVLRDIDFDGPSILEAEYPLGGADRGKDKITLPPIRVLGAMKRDVLTMRAAFMLAPKAGISI